jgi:hypothetical protein
MHPICISNALSNKMENSNVSARIELGDYANRVLGIIKIKYGLNDKSEAINKFIELYGDDVLDLVASEEYTKKVVELTNKHLKKYGLKKMNVEELDKLCEV